jgi:DNA-binding transcriptional LysR family regulator
MNPIKKQPAASVAELYLRLDLHTMRCFVAVAEEASFTRAAERLFMSQPPLTRMIARLERQVGGRLLERNTRWVRLTPAGEVLLNEARAVLARAETAVRAVRHAVVAEEGERARRAMSLSYTLYALYTLLPQLFDGLRAAYPDARLEASEGSGANQQIAALRSAACDFALLHPPARVGAAATAADWLVEGEDAVLEVRVVRRERMVVALPLRHPLAGREQIALADLSGEAFLLHPREEMPALHDATISACRMSGFDPQVTYKGERQSCAALLIAGAGVHLVAPSLENLRSEGVIYVPLIGPAPELELAAAWRRDDPSPLVAEAARLCEL